MEHSNIFRLSAALALSALIGGCALPEKKSDSLVKDADEAMVANCQYVREVTGASMYGGPAGVQRGLSIAKNEAREEAQEAGATHIVWAPYNPSSNSTAAVGRAYRCGSD